MRVLLLNYEWPPLGGGAGVASWHLARGIADAGARVDVVTAAPKIPGAPAPDVPGEGVAVHGLPVSRKGIHQAGLGGTAGYLGAALPAARQLLRERRYDLVHTFFSLPTGALLPFLSLGDAALVVSLRGSDVPGYDLSKPNLQRAHGLLAPLTRWIWRRADGVTAVCRSLADLAQRFEPAVPVEVIGNGVDVGRFRPPDEPRPASVPTPGRPLRCVTVARLVRRKGVEDLLRAWSLLDRGCYRLEVVGSGDQEGRLRALAGELGLDGEVVFRGALPHEEVAEVHRSADVFVLPPLQEAFGNVFIEAMASGLPIVGSRVGGVCEQVEDGVHGVLVPPRSPEALAAAVRELARDPERRAEVGRRNRERALRALSWEVMAQRYLSLYRRILGRGVESAAPVGEAPAGPANGASLRPAEPHGSASPGGGR